MGVGHHLGRQLMPCTMASPLGRVPTARTLSPTAARDLVVGPAGIEVQVDEQEGEVGATLRPKVGHRMNPTGLKGRMTTRRTTTLLDGTHLCLDATHYPAPLNWSLRAMTKMFLFFFFT